jgi:hypothetical protein
VAPAERVKGVENNEAPPVVSYIRIVTTLSAPVETKVAKAEISTAFPRLVVVIDSSSVSDPATCRVPVLPAVVLCARL